MQNCEGLLKKMHYLHINNLSISFGGIRAIENVEIGIERDCIFSIIGPNGAGKSTLFNCITGFYKPLRGKIFFDGKNITNQKPHLIQRNGIARTFQNIGLFKQMKVIENLLVAKHHSLKYGILREGFYSPKVREEEEKAFKDVEEILAFLKLREVKDKIVSEIPFGYQKLTEFGRALALRPKLLLIDEPSSGMNSKEKEFMSHVILTVNRNQGITVIMIEHDMRTVMKLSDQICVLNYGKKIAEGSPEEIQNNNMVIEAYLGKKGSTVRNK